MKRFFTHYSNDDPPPSGLRKLQFLTTTKVSLPKQEFFWAYGQRPFPEERFQAQIDEGSLIVLKNQNVEADGEQVLFMDSNCGIWAAHHERPLADHNPQFIEAPDGYLIPSLGLTFANALMQFIKR